MEIILSRSWRCNLPEILLRHLYYYYLYCAASVSRMSDPLRPFFVKTKLYSRDVERRGHETIPEDRITRSLSILILPTDRRLLIDTRTPLPAAGCHKSTL